VDGGAPEHRPHGGEVFGLNQSHLSGASAFARVVVSLKPGRDLNASLLNFLQGLSPARGQADPVHFSGGKTLEDVAHGVQGGALPGWLYGADQA